MNIVIGFANLFRNFSLSPYNLKKYFDGKLSFSLNNEKCLDPEGNQELYRFLKEILLSGKPGKFESNHPNFDRFVDMLKTCEIKESSREVSATEGLEQL